MKHSISGMLKKQEDADFVKRILQISGQVTQSWWTQPLKNRTAKLPVTQEQPSWQLTPVLTNPGKICYPKTLALAGLLRENFIYTCHWN